MWGGIGEDRKEKERKHRDWDGKVDRRNRMRAKVKVEKVSEKV